MRQITVKVLPLAKEKILAFAQAVTTEIGGLLQVLQEGKTLTVLDAWTVPQTVSTGSVNFEVGHFEDHIKAMGWPNGKPMPHICMGIWHSHGEGTVFMSGTDENDLVRKYAMRGYLVNIVVNRKGEWLCQVDSMIGPAQGKLDDYILVTVPSTLTWGVDPAILEEVTRQVAANVHAQPVFHVKDTGRRDMFYDRDRDHDYWDDFYGNPYPKRTKELEEHHVWTYDKEKQCLVQKDNKGRLLRSISKNGKGEVTIYDKKGRPCVITNNRTAVPRRGFSGHFLPPEL